MNGLFDDRRIYIALFAGFFIIESLLSLWTGQPYDMKVWFNTGLWMTQGINIYMPKDHLGYPPLWALWCFVAYQFYTFFSNSLEIWRFVIKLPIILSHLALAYVVGVFASYRFGQKTGLKILLVTLTWGFFIYAGAIWGQIDTISALLSFLAFYAVINKRTGISALLLGTAVTLKLYPIVVLPAFFAYVSKKWNMKEAGKYLLYSIAVPIIFTLSTIAVFRWDILYFLRTIFYATPTFQSNPTQINFGCMNLFSFLALEKINLVGLSPALWIPILAVCAFYWLRKPKLDESDLILSGDFLLRAFYDQLRMDY